MNNLYMYQYSNHISVGKWGLKRESGNRIALSVRYSWKKNYWIGASLMPNGIVIYDNPKNVPIPNYVRNEAFKLLTYGATFFNIVELHRGFPMDLWLDMEETKQQERPNYSYDVQTPAFTVDDRVYLDGVNFQGNRFAPDPAILSDKDQILDDLLGWLTLKSGDTDQSYFDSYTPKQLDWSNSQLCEEISCDLSG
jgi:hypothetical protein